MVKVILQLYPQIPATRDERIEQRPMGRDAERYQALIREMPDIIKAADELGLWGVSSIEHHFHSEGYEVGPNPGLLNAHWAAITKNIRVGQLGYTMSAQNPFRVAEDVAIIDHLAGGRSFCGFSRGYQARWTNILGQHLGTRATLSPSGNQEKMAELDEATQAARISDDQINREIFEENVELVQQAWTQDSVEWKGRWQVPFPYDEGVDWTMTATREMGAVGEMDEHGKIRRVSVTPKPLTQPHPPVFVSSNASKETVEYCGPRGFIPTYFSKIERAAEFGGAYVEAAATAGKTYALGQNQALVRWGQIAETTEEARQMVADYDVDIFRDLYAGTTPMKFDPDNAVDSVVNSGLWVVGTPEEVRDQYVELWRQLPAEYVVLIYHYAQQPAQSVIRQLELFMEHVKPALDALTDYEV
ncbi:MAG: class flavin-dependent oxidoreductase [Modestobacter sp.]|jgi:alkanesulfonate monooxygenase SsuD/methylene tetrahydromethanopterin reductase-like flavin-dependent oxidoreductase (luciferase family)|nr:class flavin-dependent oxidoreductase [Modestobacter sp.]